jgi:hypothetical protein
MLKDDSAARLAMPRPYPGSFNTPATINNRDWLMLNLEETRKVSRLLFRAWAR